MAHASWSMPKVSALWERMLGVMDDHRAVIFGGLWDASICDNAIEVPTPVGEACLLCEEVIVEGDRGQMMGVVRSGPGGEPVGTQEWIHRECALRSVMGSWGHLQGRCHCYGGTEEDPPGMSKRESAKLVWNELVPSET